MIVKASRFQGLSPIFGIFTALAMILPSQAAEKIYFIYDSLNFSLPVKSVERYAKEGKIDQNMKFYLTVVGMAGVDAQTQSIFREALNTRANIDPVLLSRILNTDEGERLLRYFGRVINVQGGRNGQYILRGAMVQAAFDEEGLTLVNFLKKLPTNIQVDLKKSIELANNIETIVNATYYFIDEVEKMAENEAKNDPKINYAQLPDLREKGPFAVDTKGETWHLVDESRNRAFYVKVYQPKQWAEGKTPVIVISHGLSSRPEDFAKFAIHLASYGYFVVLPQHLGSDIQQTKDFLAGYTGQISQQREFIDRPLDVSFLLDELERRNETEFAGKLDLENVGAMGHSFGGYTVLALAGATPDFERLKNLCALELGELNLALLLQCRALDLEAESYDFRDPRIKAVFAVNPVNAGIFGEQGLGKINIPVFIGAGSYDPATPFVFEQAVSFPWLNSDDKYLQLQEGQAHVDFSQLDAGLTDLLDTVDDFTLPSPQLLDSYTEALLVAFVQVHLRQNQNYQPYLQSSYSAYLSQDQPFKAHLITKASSDALAKILNQFRSEHNLKISKQE